MAHIWPTDLGTLTKECTLTFLRASGPGGQHRNKVETGVRLHHPESGVTVTATERRSQYQNRLLAYERMAEKHKSMNQRPKRRKPTRKPRSADRKRLESKKQRGQTKRDRKSPPS